MRNNFLILGNGADINELDFNRIDKQLITGGVNRIYLKFMPMVYYIYDLISIMPAFPDKEYKIYTHNSKLSQYMRDNVNNINTFFSFPIPEYTKEFRINGQEYKCNHSSVNMLIRILNDYIYKSDNNYFYICGVPLLEDIGHFYNEEINQTPQKVLDKIFNDFIRLREKGYKIISCMEKSLLNKLFPVENKNILYDFKEKTYKTEGALC